MLCSQCLYNSFLISIPIKKTGQWKAQRCERSLLQLAYNYDHFGCALPTIYTWKLWRVLGSDVMHWQKLRMVQLGICSKKAEQFTILFSQQKKKYILYIYLSRCFKIPCTPLAIVLLTQYNISFLVLFVCNT